MSERAGEDSPLLAVEDLTVDFATRRGCVRAVRGISFEVSAGETLGLVGESGCGKSVTAQAIMGIVQPPGLVSGGQIRWRGKPLLGPDNQRFARSVRGREVSLVFQDPITSLNPLMTIGNQLGEVLRFHLGMGARQARERARALLELVHISDPDRRLDQRPYELSGGMRQRVMIAMALACDPKLLIADEPTTALDVTIQAQILELFADLKRRLGLALVVITHDLGVVARLCDRVAVMYAGRLVEERSCEDLYTDPQHPYSAGLIRSTPTIGRREERLLSIPGMPPALDRLPVGCPFGPRCPRCDGFCRTEPPLRKSPRVACWHPGRLEGSKGMEKTIAATA